MAKHNTAAKLTGAIAITIIFLACLCITSLALSSAGISIRGNIFSMAAVSININDGKPVISKGDFTFEPGASIQREFFIENTGTADVWYKIYFSNVTGNMSDHIDVSIATGDAVLYSGKMSELTKSDVTTSETMLRIGEKLVLSITFTMSANANNDCLNETLVFDICVDATQAKNNPNKKF